VTSIKAFMDIKHTNNIMSFKAPLIRLELMAHWLTAS